MAQDEFSKLFVYLQSFRKDFDMFVQQAQEEHADIRGSITELAGQMKDYHLEFLMLSRKVDRHEDRLNSR